MELLTPAFENIKENISVKVKEQREQGKMWQCSTLKDSWLKEDFVPALRTRLSLNPEIVPRDGHEVAVQG